MPTFNTPMVFITDRTQEDVDRVKYLAKITVTPEMKYMTFQVNSLNEDIGLRIFFIMDWGT